MSRSLRKNGTGGSVFLNPGTQKNFRSKENRAKRRKVNVLLDTCQYEHFPTEKEYGNEWSSPRDGVGKWYSKSDDPKDYRK